MTNSNPHANQPMLTAGPKPETARATVICIHGRGAGAEDILSLYREFGFSDVAALAPQAASSTWYPYSFLTPMEANQPYLDSALLKIETIVSDLISRGVQSEKIALLGFSQGACLSTEFVARHPRKFGTVLGLSGGLIGPPGASRRYKGSLDNTPVFLGCSDIDPHIPFERVIETRDVLQRMGASVEMRKYPGMGHTINQDEFDYCRGLLAKL